MKRVKLQKAAEGIVEEHDWGTLHWYASGKLGNSTAMTLGRCIIKPRCENPKHLHPNCEEILHVLHGKIIQYVGDDAGFEMGPGDTVTISAGIRHNVKNVGEDDAVLMISFSSPDRQTRGE